MSSGNPIQLNYLVFDDEDEEQNQNALKVKIPGFECNLIFFNPNHYYNADNNTFDITAFKEKIFNDTKGQHIDLIATDWNMLQATENHDEINGLAIIDILLELNTKYRKCTFLIYSGKPQEASNVILSKIRKEVCNKNQEPINAMEILSLLLELKIKFCARNQRFDEIITLIKGEKTISSIVLNLLASFDDNIVINTGNTFYDGKTIGSLIELISENNDLGLKFIREFMELSIANYSEINVT